MRVLRLKPNKKGGPKRFTRKAKAKKLGRALKFRMSKPSLHPCLSALHLDFEIWVDEGAGL